MATARAADTAERLLIAEEYADLSLPGPTELVLEKVVEYLDAGVLIVCVLDPERETAQVNPAKRADNMPSGGEELSFPEILPGFAVKVPDLFAA